MNSNKEDFNPGRIKEKNGKIRFFMILRFFAILIVLLLLFILFHYSIKQRGTFDPIVPNSRIEHEINERTNILLKSPYHNNSLFIMKDEFYYNLSSKRSETLSTLIKNNNPEKSVGITYCNESIECDKCFDVFNTENDEITSEIEDNNAIKINFPILEYALEPNGSRYIELIINVNNPNKGDYITLICVKEDGKVYSIPIKIFVK